jgi:protein TonB
MSVAVANPEDLTLKRYIVYSLILHGLLTASVVISIVFHLQGNNWGSVGSGSEGDVKVSLVSGRAGIPMPPPPEITESRTFDPTDSLYKTLPQPKPPEPPKPEVKIPDFKNEKRPKQIEHRSRTFENPTPVPDNAAPSNGGRMTPPTGYQQTTGAASNGVQMSGPTGGDFAGRYPAYVEAIRRRISQNWIQSSIDPAARASRTIHATATFTINRDGSVRDIHITLTSGNSSFDTSSLRALYDSNPMPPLPADYSGSYVSVTFDFLPPGTH